MQFLGIAKVFQNTFDFMEKIAAKPLQALGIAKVFEDI